MSNQKITCVIECASLSSDFLRCTTTNTYSVVIRVSEDHRLASAVLNIEKIQELIDFLIEAKKELLK